MNGKISKSLSVENAKELLNFVDAFLFDCDGVIWKGEKLIDGVPETLDLLRSHGKKLVFVTNSSIKSRRQCAKKFHSLGIPVNEDEIFSSSFAAAMYLKVNDFPREKVYVIGEEGILEELEQAGFTALGGPADGKKNIELKSDCLFEHDKNVKLELLSLDLTNISTFISYSAGCMVAAICGTTQKEPITVGKPSTFLMDFLLQKYNITTSRMCMVGDRLDTDILFGQNAGCRTLLVFSGVTNESNYEDLSKEVKPEYYTNSIADMLKYI